jgi:hypothetical protein
MGRLYGLPIVAIAAVPKSHFQQAYSLRSCALNSKPQAFWRGLRRMSLKPCVSVPSDASSGVRALGHGGGAGGGAQSCDRDDWRGVDGLEEMPRACWVNGVVDSVLAYAMDSKAG